MKILFACSEFSPLIRTDDVAEFSGSMASTLSQLSHDIRVIMPAYPEAVDAARPLETVARLEFADCAETVRLLRGSIPGQTFPVYLVDAPGMFSHHGHPYKDAQGNNRADNLQRFSLFSQVVSFIALNQAGLSWHPDVVHCNGWQTGLVPALLTMDWNRPATVFSFHQIGADDIQQPVQLEKIRLPAALLHSPNCRHGETFSPLKAGISYADSVVSSSNGFTGNIDALPIEAGIKEALKTRSGRLFDITPGLDENRWNPVNDEYIRQPFDLTTFELKKNNKTALQQHFGLPQASEAMAVTVFDQITGYRDNPELIQATVLEELLQDPDCQLYLCCDSVQPGQGALSLAQAYPQQVAICTRPGEADLHFLLAGSDAAIFSNEKRLTRLLPVACWRYGTVPALGNSIDVHENYIHATSESLMSSQANAYLYKNTLAAEMLPTLNQMSHYYRRTGPWWKKLATSGMKQQEKNARSLLQTAHDYLECYQFAIDNPASNPDQK